MKVPIPYSRKTVDIWKPPREYKEDYSIAKMKIQKGKSLIDQCDSRGFYGGKFGGNFVAETAIKPIQDLSKLFEKLRRDKNS